jgi:four helix bundle protein
MSSDLPIRSHRDLVVWQRAKQLVKASVFVFWRLPREFRFTLGDQIVRSALSIPANIAEGRGRLSKPDNVRHLTIARGSLEELESHLEIAVELEFVKSEHAAPALSLCQEVGRMLNSQIRKLGHRNL